MFIFLFWCLIFFLVVVFGWYVLKIIVSVWFGLLLWISFIDIFWLFILIKLFWLMMICGLLGFFGLEKNFESDRLYIFSSFCSVLMVGLILFCFIVLIVLWVSLESLVVWCCESFCCWWIFDKCFFGVSFLLFIFVFF